MKDLSTARVAIYARYSSDQQRESSIDDQVQRCRAEVERAGGMVDDAMIFADRATSGASLQRTGWEALMRAAKEAAMDVIVTEDTSRISRDLADSAALYRELRYLGIALIGVADGIDTSQRGSKLAYNIKTLMSDYYLEDLKDKTLRGLEGRARAGFSTGGLPYGYRSEASRGEDGQVQGYRIVVDGDAAEVVRRIFQEYANGASFAGIAKRLNSEGVPPPRADSRKRKKGWTTSSVRTLLYQKKYGGEWTFGEREWQKVPGTNKRRYRKRDPSQVLTFERPDLAIVDTDLFRKVQQRLAEVKQRYQQAGGRKRAKRTYPFSGLIRCGCCGGPLTIYSGHPYYLYRCDDNRLRGTCSNRLTVREELVRRRLLEAIQDRLSRPEAIDYLRQQIAQKLRERQREGRDELKKHEERLARTEARIDKLVGFLADGNQSDYVTTALQDLEAQAKNERREIERLRAAADQPVELPGPEDIVRRILDLKAVADEDPEGAREFLRRLFDGETVTMEPSEDGVYTARATLLPAIFLTKTPPGDTGRRGQMQAVAGMGFEPMTFGL